MYKFIITLLISHFLWTTPSLAFDNKEDSIQSDTIPSSQDKLAKLLNGRAIDFAKKHFTKYVLQVVDHNLHFTVWDKNDYRDPVKQVEKKYKALAKKAKMAIYFDCVFFDFSAEHFINFEVHGPSYMIMCNTLLYDLPGDFANYGSEETDKKVISFVHKYLNSSTRIHWHNDGDEENVMFFGEVPIEIANDSIAQRQIIDSLGRAAFDWIFSDKSDDYLYLSYHCLSFNLTFHGKVLESGKLDRPLTDFVKLELRENYIRNIK